jgi:hypothetical protein
MNDVTSTHGILTDPDRGGFSPDDCHLMTDKFKEDRFEPIRSNIMSSITTLAETADSEDYILFFFSGHGMEQNRRSYLLPADSRANVLRDSAISLDWIKGTLGSSKARAKVMILDACHSGAIKGKSKSGTMTKGLHDTLFPAPEGFAILTSCKMYEASFEMPERKHSVFTYFLNDGLMGGADFDKDALITITDAGRYATDCTLKWASKEGVQQSPTMEVKVVRDLILVRVPKTESLSKKTEIALGKITDFSAVVSSLIIPMPKPRDLSDTEWGERFCAFLLKFHASTDIRVAKGVYSFPGGAFNPNVGTLELSYSENLREITDRLITSYLSGRRVASISWIIRKKTMIDFKRVVALQETSKLANVTYSPTTKLLRAEVGASFPGAKDKKLTIWITNPEAGVGQACITISSPSFIDGKLYERMGFLKLIDFLGNIFQRS